MIRTAILLDNNDFGLVSIKGTTIVAQAIETLIACGIEHVFIISTLHQESYKMLCEEYPEVCCTTDYKGREACLVLPTNLVFAPRIITLLLKDKKKNYRLCGICKLTDNHAPIDQILFTSIIEQKDATLEYYLINSEQDRLYAETHLSFQHQRHSYHTDIKQWLKAPYVCYRNYRYLGHSEPINKPNAKYLINTIKNVFEKHNIKLILHAGTLLGAVREHDFIGHDGDMDTMIWDKDMQTVLNLAPELAKYDIKLECYVLPWIITYSYKGITCDIDILHHDYGIWKNWFCLMESQHLPLKFCEKIQTIEFQGEQHYITCYPEEFLEYMYGKTWRIPGGAHARLQSKLFFWKYIGKFIQRVKRFLKRHLDKKHIQIRWNDLARVLNHMRKEDITSFTMLQFVEHFKEDSPKLYASWLAMFKGEDAEKVVHQQLFQYLYNQHGNLGVIVVNYDGNMTYPNIMELQWKWLKD